MQEKGQKNDLFIQTFATGPRGDTTEPRNGLEDTEINKRHNIVDHNIGRGALGRIFFLSLIPNLASPLIDIDQTLSKKRHNFNFFLYSTDGQNF